MAAAPLSDMKGTQPMAKGFDTLLGLKLRELNRRDEDHGYFLCIFPIMKLRNPRNPEKKTHEIAELMSLEVPKSIEVNNNNNSNNASRFTKP